MTFSGTKLCRELTSARKTAFFCPTMSFSWRDHHKWIFSEVRNTVTSVCKDYKVSLWAVPNTSAVPRKVKKQYCYSYWNLFHLMPLNSAYLAR